MSEPRDQRRLPTAVLIATLVIVIGGHLLFWMAEPVSSALDRVAAWSVHLIQPTLTINVLELVVLVTVWFGAFRLRGDDVGVRGNQVGTGLCMLLGGWLGIQLVRLLVAVVVGGGVAFAHGEWLLGAAAGQLLGNALVEEIVHRGLMLPQIYVRVHDGSRHLRLVWAVVVSSTIFALTHIMMLVSRGYPPYVVAGGVVVLAVVGAFFAAIYLRTGNLFVVIAVHALTNVSGDIVASPLDGRVLAFALGAGCLVWWPRRRNTASTGGVVARR